MVSFYDYRTETNKGDKTGCRYIPNNQVERGLFAVRYPARPNPIGISIVELLGREGNQLRVRGLDVLDGTPLLDIKPFAPAFDHREGARAGWLEGKA